MFQQVVLDTGPLVAFIDQRDRWHSWSAAELSKIESPLLTCEAVISEACFLVRTVYGGKDAIMGLLEDGLIQIPFRLAEEHSDIRELLNRYQSVPMSLADACLVRMSEMLVRSTVLTLDSDFGIYRMHRNQVIPLIYPSDLEERNP